MVSAIDERAMQALAALAAEWARLEEFERALRGDPEFRDVRGGVELAPERGGWRLERFVEARPRDPDGATRAWWLEVSAEGGRWRIESNACSGRDDFTVNRGVCHADSGEELALRLHGEVSRLMRCR